MTTSGNTYTVYVDDNYHYMDLEERYKLGDFITLDEAIAAFQEALRLRRGYAEAHNNLGVALIRADRLDEAIDSFRQVVTLEPGYRDAYNSLSFVLHRQGRLDEAIAVYRQAISQWPGS